MGRTIEKLIVRNYVDVALAEQNKLKNDNIRSIEIDAIVDTGATYVCIGKKEIEQLGLLFHKEAEIELKGRDFRMDVMENDDDTPALIGYLLLEALDYVVDLKTQQVIPNPDHEGKWIADLYPKKLGEERHSCPKVPILSLPETGSP